MHAHTLDVVAPSRKAVGLRAMEGRVARKSSPPRRDEERGIVIESKA